MAFNTHRINVIERQNNVSKIILNLVRKRKQIIYGARSIQKQANLYARDTKDYDIFDKNPKKAANILQKLLDRNVGFDYYYMAPAKHEGTYKVKNKGADFKKDTEDDESIADYTVISNRTYPIKNINGIRYRKLSKELIRKKATVADPEYAFRKAKDKDDINRIKAYIKTKKIIGNFDIISPI